MIIYLVRHLPTKYNEDGIIMGRSCDLSIISETANRFVETIERVVGSHIGMVYTSPALRCRQTAQFLSGGAQTLEAFNETNYGDFEGKEPEEIKIKWHDIYWKWMNHPSHMWFPGGESFLEVQSRALAGLQKIIVDNDKTDSLIFVVTHVDVIKMIICGILEIPIDKKRSFHIDHGSFTRLEPCVEKDGSKIIKVRHLNST
jgi:phosphoserine phosphatase